MYIFELIYKLSHREKSKIKNENLEEDDSINCDHIFVPVDSTKRVLACTKCGIIKKIKPRK